MKLHVLEPSAHGGYTTWGCMWKKGESQKEDTYTLSDANGQEVQVQSRVTAMWPDGSVKWTAHTADSRKLTDTIDVTVSNARPDTVADGITSEWNDQILSVHAGDTKVEIKKGTGCLFEKVLYQEKAFLTESRAILILERPLSGNRENGCRIDRYQSRIDEIEIEEAGALQTTVKLSGIHVCDNNEERFPFIIRMKIGYNDPKIDFVHTFLYDGDEDQDFLKGIGIEFSTPIEGPVYNRHVKFQGDYGMFHESMAHLNSWIPRVPQEIYASQIKGEKLEPSGNDAKIVEKVLKDMPFWDTYTFTQDTVNHFSIKKKMNESNCCFLDCLDGKRSEGGAAIGSEYGSVMCSIRDFWEKYPSGYTVSGLTEEHAKVDIWFWSPQAESMDFRHYANRGYNQVYYEGYDYKGATPYGIACTSECSIQVGTEMIPSDEVIQEFVRTVKTPIQYIADPETYFDMGAFGYWSLPSRETQLENWLEDQLSLAADFYIEEVKQRNWYGMFNFGDIMHTYDRERHNWKYDMGGYAWDNTELVPTLWLWYYFLRTGRADVFHLAQNLSRHASEVDVYHMGKYKGLGSRHNVRHWGCPCKEARIAMAGHHRVYYFLTGDHRMEDIFEELKDNEETFFNRDPLGDFFDKEKMVYPSHARSGPDWSALCSNWMMEWERTGDTRYRDKMLVGMQDIKDSPLKLISGPDFEFNPADLHLRYIGERATGGTHLQICMGAPQIWMEMADLLEDAEWKQMMAEYGRFYYLPKEEQLKESNNLIGEREFSLPFMAAAMAAYGAEYLKDEVLAERTWRYLLHAMIHEGNHQGFQTVTIEECGNHELLKEIPWITTNFVAQWCLNVIVALRFIKNDLPKTLEGADELIADMEHTTFRKA